ncbi:MAG: TIR domain-containing protein, partial [Anaerolineae bacterium]|nr:TIR domain-containing protein [Anaerolineae bacterium]
QGISESERIALMSQMRQLESTGTDFLEALVEKLLAAFPQAQRGGIVFHQDKELVPVAFRPVNRATVSFTLVRRAMIERKAFVWSRSHASLQSLQRQSLGDILAAMYAPILMNRRVQGVLYLDSSHEQAHFTEQHLAQLSEFATLTGQRIIQEGKSSLRGIPTAFVSYSRRDKAWVERFAADLRRMPISIWFDERLRVGKDWEEQLATAIQSLDAFLLVISPDSMQSEFVRWEIKQAQQANKPIYPILLRPADIPESLQKIQYLDGSDDHYAALTAELTNDLYELIQG